MQRRQRIAETKRVVVKIGSALLTNDGQGLARDAMAEWVSQIVTLKQRGVEVVLVSSGSVAAGMSKLGWNKRPDALHELQAAAAIGQMGLIEAYEKAFSAHGHHTAQILLVHEDLSDRRRYLNARNTLQTLVELGVVPIVNENDTVATDEIRFGDNDTLAAMVANIVDADTLVILTDQDAMYNKNPSEHADAEILKEESANDPALFAMAGEGGALGRGGMITKVKAAHLASRSGTNTIIAGGKIDQVLTRVLSGEDVGTLLYSDNEPLEARKLWLAGLEPVARLVLDQGAVGALKKGGNSLLPVGVQDVVGNFSVGDVVACVSAEGEIVAKGLVNYSSEDVERIKQRNSEEISALLGYQREPEVLHCDNLILL